MADVTWELKALRNSLDYFKEKWRQQKWKFPTISLFLRWRNNQYFY